MDTNELQIIAAIDITIQAQNNVRTCPSVVFITIEQPKLIRNIRV